MTKNRFLDYYDFQPHNLFKDVANPRFEKLCSVYKPVKKKPIFRIVSTELFRKQYSTLQVY